MIDKGENIGAEAFFEQQLSQWAEVRQRYEQNRVSVVSRELSFLRCQYNPARIRSTGAKTDKQSIAERPCFLCAHNRPAEQMSMPLGDGFELLVNPFPILPMHFTVAATDHRLQAIRGHYGVLRSLIQRFPKLMFFYNGPKCGASAPDHAHFQGGTSGMVPLQSEWPRLKNQLTVVKETDGGRLVSIDGWPCQAFAIISSSADADDQLFYWLYDRLPMHDDDTEPGMNIVAWQEEGQQVSVVIPRRKHRPAAYPEPTISPGALDMAGLIITPREEDFQRLDFDMAVSILKECGTTDLTL